MPDDETKDEKTGEGTASGTEEASKETTPAQEPGKEAKPSEPVGPAFSESDQSTLAALREAGVTPEDLKGLIGFKADVDKARAENKTREDAEYAASQEGQKANLRGEVFDRLMEERYPGLAQHAERLGDYVETTEQAHRRAGLSFLRTELTRLNLPTEGEKGEAEVNEWDIATTAILNGDKDLNDQYWNAVTQEKAVKAAFALEATRINRRLQAAGAATLEQHAERAKRNTAPVKEGRTGLPAPKPFVPKATDPAGRRREWKKHADAEVDAVLAAAGA